MKIMDLGIEERIRSIRRADYEGITHPDLPERQLPPQIAFLRIVELARFWDDPQTGGESLADRQQRLVTSLHGISSPWTYLILGESGNASVYWGVPCRDGETRAYEQRLSAQLPGSSWRMELSSAQILAKLVAFPVVAGISGNPSIATSDDGSSDRGQSGPGLEALFEAMAGVRWAYIVLARPLSDEELSANLRSVEEELLEVNSAHRRRGSSEESNNPQVTRYVSLLESSIEKLRQGQRHGEWEVQSYLMTDTMVDSERGAQALYGAFGGQDSEPQPLRVKSASRAGIVSVGTRMITTLNTTEVTRLASLPRREVAGLQVTEYVPFGMVGGDSGQGDIAIGTLMSGGTCTSLWFEVAKDSLAKHVFVAGVPGSGKTRTCLYLLSQLWREHRIPWLVLEPSMKSEYRALLRSSMGADVRVFTAGDESVAPLRLNPLEVPNGVHVQTHIGGLTTLFRAAFAMEAPMPYVLDEAIHRVYEDRGWDLVKGSHPASSSECQPTLGDLLETCDMVVRDLGYDNQLKGNLQAALRTRLSSLIRGAKGRMLNVRQSVPMEYLLSAPTVIEFASIGDDDEKAFLLGCLLLKLAQHCQTSGLATAGLRHVTLIEEAHRLLRNVPDSVGTSAANPRHQAIEAFCNMLAELRAFGEGLVVVDQMPSKLVPDVIRNTGLKVVHRLTAEEERQVVGGSMCLNEAQTRLLASLPAGHAVVYSDGSVNACRVCIPDHGGREGYLLQNLSNKEVGDLMKGRLSGPAPRLAPANQSETFPSDSCPIPECARTCPAETCTAKDAVERYIDSHVLIEAAFRNAMTAGFEALWRIGSSGADAIWPNGERRENGPFCVVMTIARKVNMAERDMQVLRRNMTRLWSYQREGDAS